MVGGATKRESIYIKRKGGCISESQEKKKKARFRSIQSPKGKPESTDQTQPSKVFSKREHEKEKREKKKKKNQTIQSSPVHCAAPLD